MKHLNSLRLTLKLYRLVIVLSLAVLSPGSLAAKEGFEEGWTPVVSLLNQEPQTQIPGEVLGQDLFKAYKDDLQIIKKAWDGTNTPRTSPKYNDQKNLFYQEQTAERNKLIFDQLTKFAVAGKNQDHDEVLKKVFSLSKKYNFSVHKGSKNYLVDSNIGFCFHKALMAHYFLLKNGVPQDDIKKIFALGPMIAQPSVWKFHVTTVVRSKGLLWIIDPMFKEPVRPEEWQKKILTLSAENPTPRLHFYIADARKFLPNSGIYEIQHIDHAKTRQYNPAFLSYLKKEAKSN